MAEMVGEFPDLHRTIVSERDVYLTYMLRQAARRLELPRASDGEHGACRHGAPRGTGALGCSCVSHPSRAQEVRPLRGGGRRGHGPRPRHREELDHRPQHPGDHDVSAAPPHRAGLGAGTAPPPSQPSPPSLPSVPPPSASGRVSRLAVKAAFLGLLGYGLYWTGRRAASLLLALPAARHCLQRLSDAWPHK